MNIAFVWKLTNWTENSAGRLPEFITQQINSLEKLGFNVIVYSLKKKNDYFGFRKFQRFIKQNRIELIHCHYGLTLLPCLFSRKPIVLTFIGSDINNFKVNLISSLISLRARRRIFVSKELKELAFIKRIDDEVIPYGVDLNAFYEVERTDARIKLGLDANKAYCLFPSNPNRPEKNFRLAKNIMRNNPKVEILSFNRWREKEEINYLYNAVNFVIFTSHTEGSAQVIKETCATNTPILSKDVGDSNTILNNVQNSLVFKTDNPEVQSFIKSVIEKKLKTDGRNQVKDFSLENIAKKVCQIYQDINHEID